MNKYRQTFRNHHVILPVIHVESMDQALTNANIAYQADCDGVFLINHGISHNKLLKIHHDVFQEFPEWWIGINCLDLRPQEVFAFLTPEIAGVWVDNAMIDENCENQDNAQDILTARNKSNWQGLYFGGVAFKYQRSITDLVRASQLAIKYMDVVTTSGPGTGQAAAQEKISTMKTALGDFPLSLASGVTPDNVVMYLNFVDCLLVATGISKSWTEFDPDLLTTLVSRVRAWKKCQE